MFGSVLNMCSTLSRQTCGWRFLWGFSSVNGIREAIAFHLSFYDLIFQLIWCICLHHCIRKSHSHLGYFPYVLIIFTRKRLKQAMTA